MSQKKASKVETQIRQATRVCEDHGARMTELRTLVLRLILQDDTPLTAYQILDRLQEQRRGAVPPTVYRALDFLMSQGLVHKIERLNAYLFCHGAGTHAHHAQFLICRRCGTVAEIEDAAVSTALEDAARKVGFSATVATVELDGTCAACV